MLVQYYSKYGRHEGEYDIVPALKGESAREDKKETHHYTNDKCYIAGYLHSLILLYSQPKCLSHVVFMCLHKICC